ncbi:MAG: aquaporin [Verrucomicrobiota bacterium]
MNKLFGEFLGTLILCAVALVSRDPLAIAFALAIVIYSLGYLSGGHFNPAVSVAMWLRGKMGKTEMLRYFAAQFSGALGGFVAFKLLGGASGAGPAELLSGIAGLPPEARPEPAMSPFIAGEFFFTFLLASTALHVTTAKQLAGNQFYGAAIGLCMYVGSRCAGGFSIGAFNPALGLGLVLSGAVPFWYLFIYLLAGAAAGTAAATVYRLLNPND